MLKPPYEYRRNAVTQVFDQLEHDGHRRVSRQDFARILASGNRDGIDPNYEPLQLADCEDIVSEISATKGIEIY